MVAECKSAEDGVGATIAPINHLENGSCADFVKAAKAIKAMGITVTPFPITPFSTRLIRETSFCANAKYTIPQASAVPPRRFIHKARKEFSIASSVLV